MNKNLALFFTRGMSLLVWERIGSIEREIKPYQKLAEYFNKIFIFSYGINESEKYSKLFPNNVEIVSRPRFIPVIIYSFLLPFIQRKKLRNIQIIKTNQMDGSWAAVIAKKLFGSKLVVRCGYEWLQYLEKMKASLLKRKIAYLIEKFAYNNADKVIVTSEEAGNFIKGKFQIDLDKIVLIPNYIDTQRFNLTNLKKEPGRIIFVGRLDPVKNLENLIKAMRGLSVRLIIIGEGILKEKLELLARLERVQVDFKGVVSQENLPAELNKSEIFVLPSISEGNPKVLLEAMACGLACVGSNIPSIREIIIDGDNGVLCQLDTESIHKVLVKLLNVESIRRGIGVKARQTIVDGFSFEKIIGKELNLYDQIL